MYIYVYIHVDEVHTFWQDWGYLDLCWKNCWSTYILVDIFWHLNLDVFVLVLEPSQPWWIFLDESPFNQDHFSLFTDLKKNQPLSKLPTGPPSIKNLVFRRVFWTSFHQIPDPGIRSLVSKHRGGGNNKRVRRPPIQAGWTDVVSEKEESLPFFVGWSFFIKLKH